MIGWFDAASGASGDMLLGALVGAGADVDTVRGAVAAVAPEPITLTAYPTTRAGLAATHVEVEISDSATHRGLSDILLLIDGADLQSDVADPARAVFRAIAEAEAAVHATSVDRVHFHEVGALDAIADVVGVCAAIVSLDLSEVHCSPIAVGSGAVSTSHGRLSVPPPAVAALLLGVPTYAGPVEQEMCTPTGAALLRHFVTHWGSQPPMAVSAIGVGAGGRDIAGQPNVLRLLIGSPVAAPGVGGSTAPGWAVILETNVDDLDPRLWPAVLSRLLELGASDAWLTPILMKKGRSAHTLSVLARIDRTDALREAIFAETSAIGLREISVAKRELDRAIREVEVGGQPIRVKVATLAGRPVNRQPEYDDVARAAAALGVPAKEVLALAIAAAAVLDR